MCTSRFTGMMSVWCHSEQVLSRQDQYEKALMGLQQRVQELEARLKGVQMVLHEKVQLLKEQVSPLSAGLSTWHLQHCILPLFLWSSADEERKVEQLVEGTVCGKCSADDSAADHGTAAEECREEELRTGGKSRRPQQAAERCRSRGARHVTPPL